MLRRRRGAGSFMLLGRNTQFDTPITSFENPDNAEGVLLPKRFQFTRNTLGVSGDQIQSETITANASDTLNLLNTAGAAGEWEFEILPEDLLHLSHGIFVPDTDPTSDAQADHELLDSVAGAANVAVPADDQDIPIPGRVKIDGNALGTMKVNGFIRTGRPSNQLLSVKEEITLGADAADRITKNYFAKVESVDLEGAIASASGLSLDAESGAFITGMGFGQHEFEGWTVQGRSGTQNPFISLGVIPRSMEVRFGNTVRLFADVSGSLYQEFRMIDDVNTEKLVYDETVDSGAAALSNFPASGLQFFPRWGGALYFETDDPSADAFPFNNLVVNINRNLVDDEGITGSRYAGQPVVDDTGVRQITITIDTYNITGDADTDVFVRWNERYIRNQTTKVYFYMFNFDDLGRMYRTKYTALVSQLTEAANAPVEGRGQQNRRLVFKCVPEATSATPNELTLEQLHYVAY